MFLNFFSKFARTHLSWRLFLIKLQCEACNFVKKESPAPLYSYQFVKSLRTSLLQKIFGWLLLKTLLAFAAILQNSNVANIIKNQIKSLQNSVTVNDVRFHSTVATVFLWTNIKTNQFMIYFLLKFKLLCAPNTDTCQKRLRKEK